MAKKKDDGFKIIAENRKARYAYAIDETLEAGIMLMGSEVKSLRGGKTTIGESYAHAKDGELWLVNCYIPEYTQASRFNHEPKRSRKLLVHKREANRLAAAIQREGMTLIPLKLYFNAKGKAKIELGIAKGKKLHDKRETEKQRDWARDKARLMRAKGRSMSLRGALVGLFSSFLRVAAAPSPASVQAEVGSEGSVVIEGVHYTDAVPLKAK